SSSLTMTSPPTSTSSMLVLKPAGFMAKRALTRSPGVKTSWEANWIWKPETPKVVPLGARISAGKSGKVEMSLPKTAEVVVNSPPASCIPSPESPQNRITTASRVWGGDWAVVVMAACFSCVSGILRAPVGDSRILGHIRGFTEEDLGLWERGCQAFQSRLAHHAGGTGQSVGEPGLWGDDGDRDAFGEAKACAWIDDVRVAHAVDFEVAVLIARGGDADVGQDDL